MQKGTFYNAKGALLRLGRYFFLHYCMYRA